MHFIPLSALERGCRRRLNRGLADDHLRRYVRAPGNRKPDKLLALLRAVPRKNIPMPNDTYYVSFPLGIDEFPAVDLTE